MNERIKEITDRLEKGICGWMEQRTRTCGVEKLAGNDTRCRLGDPVYDPAYF